jgi:hypothetical protein
LRAIEVEGGWSDGRLGFRVIGEEGIPTNLQWEGVREPNLEEDGVGAPDLEG